MSKIMVIALLIFLAGCQFVPFQRKETMQLPDVNIGTQGVELSLAPNNPPRETFENSAFTMLVTLSNLGTTDVEDGVYTVSHEPQYVYLAQQKQQGRFVVRGKSTFNPQGEERQVSLTFTTKPLGPQAQQYPTTIAFNACYPYRTIAPLVTCIDSDILNKRKDKACTPQPASFPQGHGAPVVVASIEPRMLPHEDPMRIRPEFILTLQNKGSGEVTAVEHYREACAGRALGDQGWNIIQISATLSDTYLTCTPSPAKLKQASETRVVCTIPEGIDARLGTYTAPLTVELEYGYLTSITTQVNIIKALT